MALTVDAFPQTATIFLTINMTGNISRYFYMHLEMIKIMFQYVQYVSMVSCLWFEVHVLSPVKYDFSIFLMKLDIYLTLCYYIVMLYGCKFIWVLWRNCLVCSPRVENTVASSIVLDSCGEGLMSDQWFPGSCLWDMEAKLKKLIITLSWV